MSALPEGESRKRLADREVMKALQEKWAAMSKEEQVEVTKDGIGKMLELRAMRQTGQHHMQLALLGDIPKTIDTVTREVSILLPTAIMCG